MLHSQLDQLCNLAAHKLVQAGTACIMEGLLSVLSFFLLKLVTVTRAPPAISNGVVCCTFAA